MEDVGCTDEKTTNIKCTLGPAYIEQIDAKKTARCRRVLVVTELFNIAVNDFDAKKFAPCRRVLVVTELVVSGTQCTLKFRVGFEDATKQKISVYFLVFFDVIIIIILHRPR